MKANSFFQNPSADVTLWRAPTFLGDVASPPHPTPCSHIYKQSLRLQSEFPGGPDEVEHPSEQEQSVLLGAAAPKPENSLLRSPQHSKGRQGESRRQNLRCRRRHSLSWGCLHQWLPMWLHSHIHCSSLHLTVESGRENIFFIQHSWWDLANLQFLVYLHIDVYLRAWEELGHHSSFKRLLQVETHLGGFAISVWSPLPLSCAERGHAVLAIDDSSIVKSPTSGAPHLKQTQTITSNNKSPATKGTINQPRDGYNIQEGLKKQQTNSEMPKHQFPCPQSISPCYQTIPNNMNENWFWNR